VKVLFPQQVTKFPAFYGNRRFYYRVHNSRHLSPSPARSIQSNPYILLLNTIHLNIILPSTPSYSKRSLSFTKPLYAPILSPTRSTSPAHLILFNLTTHIIFGWECRLSNSSLQYPPLLCYLVVLRCKYLPYHPTPIFP
jgi:hypothetical protein